MPRTSLTISCMNGRTSILTPASDFGYSRAKRRLMRLISLEPGFKSGPGSQARHDLDESGIANLHSRVSALTEWSEYVCLTG